MMRYVDLSLRDFLGKPDVIFGGSPAEMSHCISYCFGIFLTRKKQIKNTYKFLFLYKYIE